MNIKFLQEGQEYVMLLWNLHGYALANNFYNILLELLFIFQTNKLTKNNDLLGKGGGTRNISIYKDYSVSFKVSSVHIDCC